MIIKLFRAKIKLGQGARAAKAQAIDALYKQSVEPKPKPVQKTKGSRRRPSQELR